MPNSAVNASRVVLRVNFFVNFEMFCIVVAMSDLVHNMEAIYDLYS